MKLVICPALLAAGLMMCSTATAAPAPFRFSTDRFAFANETVWNYAQRSSGKEDAPTTPANRKKYSRRCFVLARAAVQFWKFARFDTAARPLSDAQLTERIRRVTERDVWREPLPFRERVVFPGYANLLEMSRARGDVLRANVGLGWPTYFRPGNFSIIAPVTRAHQQRTAGELRSALAAGIPTILWLVNFPSLTINHAVVVYDFLGRRGGREIFRVYDSNDARRPKELAYDPASRTFFFERTFYFAGGRVNVRPVYRSSFQ